MPNAKLAPSTVYLILIALTSFASVLAFTANLVYQVDDAGLGPLQLVLVGTVWEATYFVFEVPTGVVADVFSRRLSVLIGVFVSAAGLALVGAWPRFETIVAAYVVLGIGGTFVSGAQDAWVADEVGPERAGDIFLRSSQWARGAGLMAIPLAAALGSIDIAGAWSIRAGLVVAGLILAPVLPLYSRALGRRVEVEAAPEFGA